MSEFDGGGGDGGGITIAGKKIPTWALLLGAGGLIFLVLQNKGSGETTQTDTGTGLLAAELDQRLNEFWEAIKASLEDKGSIKCGVGFHLEADGKTCHQDDPGGTSECSSTKPCSSGKHCEGGTCVSDQCQYGYVLINGMCQPPNPPSPTGCPGGCIEGFHCEGNSCVQDNPIPVPPPPSGDECDYGYVKVNGVCQPPWVVVPDQTIQCGSGYVYDARIGDCVPDKSGGYATCPAGQMYDKTLQTCIGYPVDPGKDPVGVDNDYLSFGSV